MYEQIVAILAKQLQIDSSKITEDTDIVEALMELEQTFSISVPDEEIVKFRTPKDILNYIASKKG